MVEVKETERVDTTGYDGRFGEYFDDEVSISGVLWTTVGLAIVCALGMLITWGMWSFFESRAAAAVQPSPIAEANEQRMPDGPLLQTDPEGELEALRHEMAERLGGYGWVDEGAGTVHIPIDEAMGLLVEKGSVAVGGGSTAPAPAEEATE